MQILRSHDSRWKLLLLNVTPSQNIGKLLLPAMRNVKLVRVSFPYDQNSLYLCLPVSLSLSLCLSLSLLSLNLKEYIDVYGFPRWS